MNQVEHRVDENIITTVDEDSQSVFIAEETILDFCESTCHIDLDSSKLRHIINIGLLPQYTFNSKKFVLKSDLVSLLCSIKSIDSETLITAPYLHLFSHDKMDSIKIGENTVIDLASEEPSKDPTFFSATRNLISSYQLSETGENIEHSISYFSDSRLTTLSSDIFELAKSQLLRCEKADMTATSQFARSAHYMGSKRQLCSFLVEAISSALPESGVIVDLMCGSGVASGAFSKIWDTYASDAQEFCRILAVIHGGGFERSSAKEVISKLLPIARQHFEQLQSCFSDELEAEDDLFCCDIDRELIASYKEFVRAFPALHKGNKTKTWDPQAEVSLRRVDKSVYPYCLFTAYFTNVYFGLRQCVEIDSLRFAIDQLDDKNEKTWALGALIATLSALGTTFGGHFAQPGAMNLDGLSDVQISKVIDKRSFSITHEFSIRLLNLSEKSQSSPRGIDVVPGPWENALNLLASKLNGKDVLVYLDAPYTREEYSRYYHVLETLAVYSYPSCTGKGLTPIPGERFRSDFFTKNEGKITAILVNIITNILSKGWSCAWSYSDSGAANICNVINTVYLNTNCDIKSYSVPFVHKSQGGALPKNVNEFLVIFSRKEKS